MSSIRPARTRPAAIAPPSYWTRRRDGRWPGENAPAPNLALTRGSYIDGVLHVVERLADALHYMHSQGIVHRDLKPSNVLVCPNGVPMLLDFNLALDREVTDYRLGGTLPYMPPEQLRAIEQRRGYRPGCADARTDLYGLGVILYELLAGAHPFGSVPSKLSTLAARDWLLEQQQRGPRPIQELNGDVDARLAEFTRRCLAANVQDRPSTAEEMLAALRQFQSPRVRARRWARANWKSLTAASVLALFPRGRPAIIWPRCRPLPCATLRPATNTLARADGATPSRRTHRRSTPMTISPPFISARASLHALGRLVQSGRRFRQI